MRHALYLMPLTLLGCVAQSPAPSPLEGSEWRFVTIDGSAPASEKAGLGFGVDRFSGTAGCNRLAGPWRIEKGRLIAGPLMQTKMFCAGKVGEQERNLSALLVSAPEIALEGNRLKLSSSGHSAELERAASE